MEDVGERLRQLRRQSLGLLAAAYAASRPRIESCSVAKSYKTSRPVVDLEVMAAVLGAVSSVVGSVAALAYWLGRKFADMDRQLKSMGADIQALDVKMEKRFAAFAEWGTPSSGCSLGRRF